MSYYRKTGNVRLLKKANIEILKEILSIKVIGDFTIVNVEYVFQNNGDDDIIWYGFPIDYYGYDWGKPDIQKHGNSAKFNMLKGTGNNYSGNNYKNIEYFNIHENNRLLKVTSWSTDSIYSIKLYNKFQRQITNFSVYRKWYVSKINFNSKEVKTINVEYKIKNNLKDIRWYKYISISDRKFSYHLTPSSNWGTGIIKDFSLSINIKDLIENGSEFQVEGIEELKRDSFLYTFNAKNYDLKKSERINIIYDCDNVVLAKSMENDLEVINAVLSIKTSSNQEFANNLIDGDINTVWTGKKGDWIEIVFNKNKINTFYTRIDEIWVLNGNYSSRKEFENSGKIKKIYVRINNVEYHDYSKKIIIKIDKPIYRDAKDIYKKGFATELATRYENPINNLNSNTRTIKFKIVDIWSGNKDDNSVSLSELFFINL